MFSPVQLAKSFSVALHRLQGQGAVRHCASSQWTVSTDLPERSRVLGCVQQSVAECYHQVQSSLIVDFLRTCFPWDFPCGRGLGASVGVHGVGRFAFYAGFYYALDIVVRCLLWYAEASTEILSSGVFICAMCGWITFIACRIEGFVCVWSRHVIDLFGVF